MKNRNEERFRTNIEAGRDFDTKNMMHVFRLIGMTEDLVRTGRIVTQRPDREMLLKIKRGERSYDDLMHEAEQRLASLEESYPSANLPIAPDRKRALDVLCQIRETFYSRSAEGL